MTIAKNFIQTQEITEYFPADMPSFAIAVSGGADSMCLAVLSRDYAKLRGSKMIALIVDHGLRTESSKEAALVQKRLKALGVSSEILKWTSKKPSSNIQEKAREARYKLLYSYCKEHGIKHLMTAHTKNDQAETVLLRILRGSGIDGVSAMKPKLKRDGLTILRPLLEFTRDEVISTLKHHKVKWVEDPSNKNEKYERIRIRNLINSQKDSELWIQRLTLLASNAARSKEFLELETNKILKKYVTLSNLGYALFQQDRLSSLHPEMFYRVLSKILMTVSGNKKRQRFSSLKGVNLRKTNTLWGCIIRNKQGICYVYKEPSAVVDKISGAVWDSRFKVSKSKKVKVTQTTPAIWRKLKGMTDIKLPIHDIAYSIPVAVNNDNEIVGSPLVKKLDVKMDFILKF